MSNESDKVIQKEDDEEFHSAGQISLDDVLAAHPAEDPSETKLLRILEEGGNSERKHGDGSPDQVLFSADEGYKPRSRPRLAVEDELVRLASKTSLGASSRNTTVHHLSNRVANDPNLNSFERNAAKLMSRAAKISKDNVKDSQDESGNKNEKNVKVKKDIPGFGDNEEEEDLRILAEFKSFVAYRKKTWLGLLKLFVLYSLLPFGGMAAFLFYAFPQTVEVDHDSKATVSWWLLFIGVRQVFTLMAAMLWEAIVIDFFAVHTRVALNTIGPFFTLMLVQSKGWTFRLFVWAAIDFAVLYGDSPFARHWLFFLEDWIELFSRQNTAGKVLQSERYSSLLFAAMFVSAAVAVKRFSLGLWNGRSVYIRYGKELAHIMKRTLLIEDVATLAHDRQGLQKGRQLRVDPSSLMRASTQTFDSEDNDNNSVLNGNNKSWTSSDRNNLRRRRQAQTKRNNDEDNNTYNSNLGSTSFTKFEASTSKFIIDTTDRDEYAGGDLSISQKLKVADLLGAWEDPVRSELKIDETASISAVVNFRAALSVIDHNYPFSRKFGRAATREECIDSAQRLFLRLEEEDGNTNSLLKFDLLAAAALDKYGVMDQGTLKLLIQVFRPTRKGELTMLDFVKSVDSVYKDLRTLEASVENARRMNRASEEVFNAVYYFVVACFALSIMGIDPLAIFGGITAVLVGLAFMIGGATSNWFEGMLFILVRKPYDIGDRIAVSDPEVDVSTTGSTGWIVKDVNLYYTTVIYGLTMEEATYSNFSLSSLRIINHNRSPKAFLNFVVRVGIATPKATIKQFAEAVKDYVKARPRQWLSFTAFRLTHVQVEQGYAEYKIFIQHRESWQQYSAILNSKADVQLYAYELSKELGMEYESPATPIIFRNSPVAAMQSEKDSLAPYTFGSPPGGDGGDE